MSLDFAFGWNGTDPVSDPVADPVAGQVAGRMTPPVNRPVTPPVAVLIRLIGAVGELGNAEILKHLGLRDRAHLRERYLNPSLEGQWIEMTIPDKPNSRLQRYRLTVKGAGMLARLQNELNPP